MPTPIVDELRAESRHLRAVIKKQQQHEQWLLANIAALKDVIKRDGMRLRRLEIALDFYAQPYTYEPTTSGDAAAGDAHAHQSSGDTEPIWCDRGETAREALETGQKGGPE